jgi:type 1 glutamine amidotransferase
MNDSGASQNKPFRVLVFSKTASYRHASIPAGIAGIQALAEGTGWFTVEATEDAELAISTESLANYATVVFLQTSGDFLTPGQLDALRKYVENGGGFVGIHCAAAGMLNDKWYGQLVGAHFVNHPEPQNGRVKMVDSEHFIAKQDNIPSEWKAENTDTEWTWFDEWYNFTHDPSGSVHLLLTADGNSFTGGTMGNRHPIAWYQKLGQGRSFYTALGHFDAAYSDKRFMGQILNAILWTARRDHP